MSIIGLQRRLREIGRIRMGETRQANSGKTYPAKLDTFRFTSPDRAVIDAAAQRYGGDVTPWDAPDGRRQWQVTTTSNEIDVAVPAGERIFSQFYELWAEGGCQRRCDGENELLGDQPCLCDPGDRECQPTTRLSIMLPDLPGLGVWRLESHGWNAAVEMAGVVGVLERAAQYGAFYPARLRAEERTAKRYDNNGRSVTHRFVVPTLDIGLPIGELLAGRPELGSSESFAATGELPGGGDRPEETARLDESAANGDGRPATTNHLRTVPPRASRPPSIEEQLARIGSPTTTRRRRSDPMPPTGVDIPAAGTRTAPPSEPATFPGEGQSPQDDADGRRGSHQPESTVDPESLRRRIMAEMAKTWPDANADERDDYRHALGVIATFTGRAQNNEPPVASVSHMTLEERMRLSTFMSDVRTGRMFIEYMDSTPEGHRVLRSWVKGGHRTAILTRRAVDDWTVEVHEGTPDDTAPEP